MTGWTYSTARRRWEYWSGAALLYWIHVLAVGTVFDNPEGFVSPVTGERVPPLPPEARSGEAPEPAR